MSETKQTIYFLVLCIVSAFIALHYLPYQIDDAFITYRYVENLLSGYGFSFNSGQQATEGFSSPAWLFLLAALHTIFLEIPIPLISQVIGFCFFILSIYFLIERTESKKNEYFFLVPTTFFILAPDFIRFSITGLETSLFYFCILAIHCDLLATNSLHRKRVYVFCAIAIWTRPEAAWLSINMFLILFLQRNNENMRSLVIRAIGICFVSGVLLLTWRYTVFDDFLPNTWYAKPSDLQSGLTYIIDAFKTPWIVTIYSFAVVAAFTSKKSKHLLICSACWIVPPVIMGGDWMDGFRFLLPSISLAILAIAQTELPTSRNKQIIYFTCFICSLVFFIQETRWNIYINQNGMYVAEHERNKFQKWFMTSEADSIALVDIGQIGFDTKAEIVDLAGLTDSVIGRASGSHLNKNLDLNYIFLDRKPDLITIRLLAFPKNALTIKSGETLPDTIAFSGVESDLLASKQLYEHYQLHVIMGTKNINRLPYYGFAVFKRKDLLSKSDEVIKLMLIEDHPQHKTRTPSLEFLNPRFW